MTAEARDHALPVDLRDRVIAAALRARGAGRAEPAAPEISPAEAFRRAAAAFHGTLRELRDDQWRTPALRGLDVRGLVGHLTGVEEDMQRCLAGDPAVAAAGHVESTQAAADRQAGRPPDQTRVEWRSAADRTIALTRGRDPRAEVAVHGMRLPLDLLLVIRAFELWVHENDIRAAVGSPPSAPDASTLTLMTSAAVRLLPLVAARTGLDEPTNVHLVLTGPGGGTWDISLGRTAPAPAAVAIVTDALGFCRLAANRATPASLDAHVTGDPDRAAAVLAAATALALD
ncbi:MAG TPA: maleylpyruvate isomerase family mycothiol-dependent enzyme [Trebonia sp.]